MKDSEEDMEEIGNEEAEWIDYPKRSTKEAEERMKSAEVPLLDRSTQKDEMEICDVNCMFSRGTMVNKGSRMEPRPHEQR